MTEPMPVPSAVLRSVAVAALVMLSTAACQPVEGPLGRRAAPVDEQGAAEATAPGAPPATTRMPSDLGALIEGQRSAAEQWQADPAPVQIVAELRAGTWVAAIVLYVAADADRFLQITADDAGTGQQRPTLDTLGLVPIDAFGVSEVPPLPAGMLAPAALASAAAAALDDCGVGGQPDTVLYASGAPSAWDGSRWTEPLVWTATVAVGDDGVTVDPVTAAPVEPGCLAG
jgi:hypothetical protein